MGLGRSFIPSFILLIFCDRVDISHSEQAKVGGLSGISRTVKGLSRRVLRDYLVLQS